MHFNRKDLSDDFLRSLYSDLLLPRLIEEKMLIQLRQGKISKWFSGIGQEAISVGLVKALKKDDYLLPLHRNLGAFTTRGLDLKRLFCQWQGKKAGYTNGRDRSFHFASPEDRVIGMISHLGAMLPVADGLALGAKLKGEDYIAVAYSGDGGTSEGDFHEAINVAAVWDLPVLFLIENNGYGLSTPTDEQFRAHRLADRALGYGIEGHTIEGNNVLEVYHTVKELAEKIRQEQRPMILECMTFRMRGHEEASGVKYVPQELFDQWKEKDPIATFERYLIEEGVLDAAQVEAMRAAHKDTINTQLNAAYAEPDITPDLTTELTDVFAPFEAPLAAPDHDSQVEMRFIDAISDALEHAMHAHPELVLMGQDIAEYGGAFKITDGFVAKFGKERVRNTPICESAILGAGLGLSLAGHKAMIEMQFADFVSCGFNQIANNLAKTHYRWGHASQVVVRMPTGGSVGAGPFHSQSNESWFAQIPGLKVVYPSNPADAKGLLATSILDPNPVLFFEHKALYRAVADQVPTGHYHLPLGKARVALEGDEITIVTYGLGVHWALAAAEKMEGLEVVDLRSLIPWDEETVYASVRKTGKCLVLYEDTATGAFGAEICAKIAEDCFESLDAPVRRLGSQDTPIPFNKNLESQFLAVANLDEILVDLKAY